MKKVILIIMAVVVTSFTSCGSSSSATDDSNQTQTEVQIKNLASLEMNYNFGGEQLLNRRNYLGVIDNSQEYEAFISEIKEAEGDSNLTLESIDFTKANLLVYLTKYNAKDQLSEYNESITINNQNAIIEQHFTGHLKEYEEYCGRAVQIRIYQVDNAINNVTMIHEDEILQIDMHNPMQESENNITNISTTTSGVGYEETKVFNDNTSWQRFLIENNNSTLMNALQNQTIDFEQNNILILTQTGSYGDAYKMEEIVVQQFNNKASITWQYVPVNYMYCDYAPATTEYITRVYKVSKAIEGIEINSFNKTIKVDMVNDSE